MTKTIAILFKHWYPNKFWMKTLLTLFFSLKTDIQLGKRCGLKTLMVGSGVDTLETAKSLDESHSPDYFVQTLGDLVAA